MAYSYSIQKLRVENLPPIVIQSVNDEEIGILNFRFSADGSFLSLNDSLNRFTVWRTLELTGGSDAEIIFNPTLVSTSQPIPPSAQIVIPQSRDPELPKIMALSVENASTIVVRDASNSMLIPVISFSSAHLDPIKFYSLSPDGHTIVIGHTNNRICVYNTKSQALIFTQSFLTESFARETT